jgi:hypothetical protein
MKKRYVQFVIPTISLALVLCAVTIYGIVGHTFKENPHLIVPLESHNGGYIDEEQAINIAESLLSMEGLDLSDWKPVQGSPSVAPDGRKDHYFLRNTIDPAAGIIRFVNGANAEVSIRDVEISRVSDKQVKATVTIAK